MARLVPAVGPLDARIVCVGEAPGADEERQGEPFVGKAGRMQDAIFTSATIPRREVYYTNLIKERPPGNKIAHFFSKPGVPNERGRPHIEAFWEEIQALDPNVIVALGAYPTATLLGEPLSIQRARGHVERAVHGVKCIPMFHPAALLRMPSLSYISRMDARKVAREAESPCFPWIERKLIVEPTAEEAVFLLGDMLDGAQEVGFDFETLRDVGEPVPTMLSFAPRIDYSVSVPIRGSDGELAYTVAERGEVARLVERIITAPDIRKVAQNAMFDLSVLAMVYGVAPRGEVFDTMVAHAALYPNLVQGPTQQAKTAGRTGQKDLEFLASVYTNEPLHKKGKTSLPRMNAIDSAVTLEIALVQETLLKATESRYETYYRTMNNLEPCLAMTVRGVGWDKGAQATLVGTLTSQHAAALDAAQVAVWELLVTCDSFPERWVLEKVCKAKYKKAEYGTREYWEMLIKKRGHKAEGRYAEHRLKTDDPHVLLPHLLDCTNVNSDTQLKYFLYVCAGVPLQTRKRKTFGGKKETVTVDDAAMRTLRTLFQPRKNPRALAIVAVTSTTLELRRIATALQTFAQVKVSDDGRFRATFNIAGTYTGRFSSSKWFDRGMNVQNFPRETRSGVNVRNLLVADPGYVLLEFDLKQAEDRFVAWDAADQTAMRLYEEQVDPYQMIAGWVFEKEPSEVMGRERYICKRAKLAFNYGIGPVTLSAAFAKDGFDVSVAECRKVLRRIALRFPNIERWKREIETTLLRNEYLETPFGRRSRFMDRKDDSMFRAGFAFKPQSTIGELTNHVMQRVYHEILPEEPSVDLLMQQHDAVILQAPLFEAERIAARVEPLYDVPLDLPGGILTIPIEPQVGVRWGEMYEYAA